MSMRNPNGFIRPNYNPLEVADAPTAVTPTAGVEGASIDFTPPTNVGGAAVSDYYAVVQPGNITATSVTPPVAVTGLTIGTTYTTKVWANNSYGPSPYSPQSGGFVPVAASYVEDVFSTYLYTGNGSTQTITNGIDLDGEGGLVWIKPRDNPYGATNHFLRDTIRGGLNVIFSNTTAAGNTLATGLTFNSNGFTTNSTSDDNYGNIVSWTFRKQPKFFDVVTYTGTGTARTVSHNLGSVPGTIIVKVTDNAGGWQVYHRSTGATKYLVLNETQAAGTSSNQWNNTAPTDSVFTVGNIDTNESGRTYVAYLFAHNAGGFGDDGEQNVISCGGVTLDAGQGNVNLGYEPQWVMYKRTDGAGNWIISDSMRGWTALPYQGEASLLANSTAVEGAYSPASYPNSTGFLISGSGEQSFIYIAIRRGPMATPTSGTEVFAPIARTGTNAAANITTAGFPPDLLIGRSRLATTSTAVFVDRLRGHTKFLQSAVTDAEGTSSSGSDVTGFLMNGFSLGTSGGTDLNTSGASEIYYPLKRAPSVFDVVAYAGTGVTRTVAHNLGVAPEMMIIKDRTNPYYDWKCYNSTIGPTKYLTPNSTGGAATQVPTVNKWNDTAPTATVFSVGTNATLNGSGDNYIAYLFATLAGVSKVGSYTGTGADLNVDCGFSAGARFILIKRTDSSGDWYVWDSARGIVAGNDPYLLLNNTAAEVTNTDYIDPLASGFTVTSNASGTVNVNTGTYIFLAIA
jgi:hypothetical protein